MDNETFQANKKVNQYWDSAECVAEYDAKHAEGIGAELDDTVWMQEFKTYLPPAPARVLDLGCGTGFSSVLLAQLGYDVIALDQSEKMLKEALQKTKERDVKVQFVQGNAMAPQLFPSSLDIVMARWVFWTLPDPVLAVRHAYRMLEPGGTLVVFDGTWFKNPECTGDSTQKNRKNEAKSPRNRLWADVYSEAFLDSLPLLADNPMDVLSELMQKVGFIDVESGYMPHSNEIYRKHRGDNWKEDQLYFVRATKPKA